MHQQWVIPPQENGEFVARMEDVLEVYRRPYDPDVPVICMDEQPVQLLKETREPIPMARRRPARSDYEYERAGTASVFLFVDALRGWRRVEGKAHRTAVDWAQQIRQLLEKDYPHVDRLVLVCDNLNTHKLGSLYEAFEPSVARTLASRLEIHFTPKHGSWLNIAESELSVMTRQCLGTRTPDSQALSRKMRAWTRDRNSRQYGVTWRFTTQDARIRLRRLYPQPQMT